MNAYESLIIFEPSCSDEDVEQEINKLTDLITGEDGKVIEVNRWGRKKLAYPIKKFSEGNYILSEFETNTVAIKKIDTSLKMNEDILRHLVIKTSV